PTPPPPGDTPGVYCVTVPSGAQSCGSEDRLGSATARDHIKRLNVNHSSTPLQMMLGSVEAWVKSR
ncbi:hypothetical protein, partial [Acetobacter indonesiensis]|uniref:hypothetical protein n=1 Tax=Acetobacter indonesiensis TaxID=104101 RepID=UPI001C4EDD58